MTDSYKIKKTRAVAVALLLMAAFQAAKILLERAADAFVPEGDFPRRMTTAAVMLLLAGAVMLLSRVTQTPLSVFPRRFGRVYIILTCVAAALLISSPSNFTGGYRAVLLAVYGSIVTPVYEELLFRGFIWKRLDAVMSEKISVYIWNIILFGVWHIGYVIPQLFSGNLSAVFGKLAAGLFYGAILGFVRLKTGCCYPAMLAHGVLNIFMV